MDPVIQAKAITFKAQESMTFDLMEGASAGEGQRIYDYIKVELPLLIEAHEGRDPTKLEGLSERQKTSSPWHQQTSNKKCGRMRKPCAAR